MIDLKSRQMLTKYFLFVVLVCIIVVVGTVTNGFAQVNTNKPTSLLPGKDINAPVNPPLSKNVEKEPPVRKLVESVPSSRSRIPLAINIQELEKLDSDSIGTLTKGSGGFGISMWEGTNRSLIDKLLPKLPINSSSRAMRSLIRRLLLSAAKAPGISNTIKDKIVSEQPGEKASIISTEINLTGKLLSMRIERLLAMGDLLGATNLLNVAPNRDTDPMLLKNQINVLFLSNDNARACSLVLQRGTNFEPSYWQKSLVYCQALAGEIAKANLGADLLREIGEKDPTYFGLLNLLLNQEKFMITSLTEPSPLHFSMIRAAKIKLPKNFTSSNNAAVLKTIATSPNMDPALRIETAERAEAVGALQTTVLRELYASVNFPKEILDNALSQSTKDRSALSRALLYRKALNERIPTAKAEILSIVFKIAREDGKFHSAARLYHHILRDVPATKDLVWFAPEAARALLAAGDSLSAESWFNVLVPTTGLSGKKAVVLRDHLAPLARLTGQLPDEKWNEKQLDNWWKFEIESSEKKSVNFSIVYGRATLLYSLLEALGDRVPARRWEPLLKSTLQPSIIMPPTPLWRMLNQAVTEVKLAETVLLSMLMLGEFGPTQVNPIVLRQVIISLRRVGLHSDARALALEAAVAAGL
jgi:hypothetical protein